MMVVSCCLPSDALSQCLPSYWGFSNLGRGVSPLCRWLLQHQAATTPPTAVPGIKISGRNINNLSYADDTTLIAESEKELKSLLMKVKEETEKVDLKLSIQKTKIMASGPITSWEIDGETVEDFILGGSKITEDGDCSHEIKRCACSLEENLWPT